MVNPNVWANSGTAEPSQIDVDVPHGMWLTASDLDNLKHFIQDFTIRSLIPYVEKLAVVLNDAVSFSDGPLEGGAGLADTV